MHRALAALAISAIAVLTPTWSSAETDNNEQVARQIRDTLRTSGRLSGYSFVIKYQDGTAWLDGRVSSEEQKAIAVEMTSAMPDVSRVVEHLRIEPRNSTTVRVSAEQTLPVVGGPVVKAARLHRMPATNGNRSAAAHEDVREQAPEQSPEECDTILPVADAEVLPALGEGAVVNVAANEDADTSNAVSLQPIPEAPGELTEPAPLAQPRHVMRQTASRRSISHSTVARRPITNNRRTTSGHAQQGQIRMVPMMEMPDGRLVPVQQAQRQAQRQPQRQPLGQPISTRFSSARRSPSNRRSNSTHRMVNASQIEGPVDVGPMPVAPAPAGMLPSGPMSGAPLPAYVPGVATGVAPAHYDQPHMPNYAWPAYASHPNYAGLTYPRQYSPTAWPYIGPFYPYPQVPLGWRKVTLEWDDGWWFLDFDDTNRSYAH
jgi:hypothetical protein